MTMNYIGKREHFIKNSHGRCLVGTFDIILHEGSIWTGHRAVLSFILQKPIFFQFLHHGTRFYDNYIKSDDIKKCIYDDGSSNTMQNIKRLI